VAKHLLDELMRLEKNMDKQDSMLMRAIAEVAFAGYIDQYGNRVDVISQIMNQFKPSEDFYKKLEKKIDVEKLADRLIEKMSLSNYDRTSFNKEVTEKAKQIVAQKLADKMLTEINTKTDDLLNK